MLTVTCALAALACANNGVSGGSHADAGLLAALVEREDRAIGTVLQELRSEAEYQPVAERWIVEARQLVEPLHPDVRPEDYEPRKFSDEVRQTVAEHGYRICQAEDDAVCPQAWQAESAAVVAIGAAKDRHPGCPLPVWVSKLTLLPNDPTPELQHSAWIELFCLAEGQDDTLDVIDRQHWWSYH
jgi:hypothetical protein